MTIFEIAVASELLKRSTERERQYLTYPEIRELFMRMLVGFAVFAVALAALSMSADPRDPQFVANHDAPVVAERWETAY
ncbi:hypothetical protein [Rhizobium binxianense]